MPTKPNDNVADSFRAQLAADHLAFVAECIIMMQGGNLSPQAYRLLTEAIDAYRKTQPKPKPVLK